MRRMVAMLLTVSLLLAGCGPPADSARPLEGSDPSSSPSPQEQAVTWSDSMRPKPLEVAPGGVLELYFSEGFGRGVSFWLERRQAEGWTRVFQAVSVNSETASDRPQTVALPEQLDVPDVAVFDAGPDRIAVPGTAEPGQWRVCLGEHPSTCARFEVVDAP